MRIQAINNRLFTGSFDGSLRVWDLSNLSQESKAHGQENPKTLERNSNSFSEQPDQISVENETSFYNRSMSNDQNVNNKIRVRSRDDENDHY